MSKRLLARTAQRRARLRAYAAAAVVTVAVVTGTAAACSSSSNTEPGVDRISYGPAQILGQGSARAYVVIDGGGLPISLGVAISESAMTGLPETPIPGHGMSAADLFLVLPEDAKITGFDHVMLDWNPMGHEPAGVYTLPHFDFHFFNISTPQQMAIDPADPQFNAKLDALPAAQFRPAGMFKLPGGVPMMGAHWADPTSPELLPPPATQQFTRTFLYGSYDGHFVFFEPMITKAYIQSSKLLAANAVTSAIKLPTTYEHSGFYPTQYTVAWNEEAKEYRISLDNLVQQP